MTLERQNFNFSKDNFSSFNYNISSFNDNINSFNDSINSFNDNLINPQSPPHLDTHNMQKSKVKHQSLFS